MDDDAQRGIFLDSLLESYTHTHTHNVSPIYIKPSIPNPISFLFMNIPLGSGKVLQLLDTFSGRKFPLKLKYLWDEDRYHVLFIPGTSPVLPWAILHGWNDTLMRLC